MTHKEETSNAWANKNNISWDSILSRANRNSAMWTAEESPKIDVELIPQIKNSDPPMRNPLKKSRRSVVVSLKPKKQSWLNSPHGVGNCYLRWRWEEKLPTLRTASTCRTKGYIILQFVLYKVSCIMWYYCLIELCIALNFEIKISYCLRIALCRSYWATVICSANPMSTGIL